MYRTFHNAYLSLYALFIHFKLASHAILDIEDSQTGMKVFSRVPLALAIGNCNESRFLFDIELMSILNNLGYKMVPIPVILDYQYSSSISLLSTLRMIDDTVKLGWRFRQTKKLLKRS